MTHHVMKSRHSRPWINGDLMQSQIIIHILWLHTQQLLEINNDTFWPQIYRYSRLYTEPVSHWSHCRCL